MPTEWSQHFANRTHRMEASAIRELLKVLAQSDIISFAGGIPANETLPVQAVREACERILTTKPYHALQYGATDGYLPLRELIAEMYRKRGVPAQAENILLTTGSQQGLDLIGKTMINENAEVLIEKPTYVGMLTAWRPFGADFVGAPMDDQGVLIDDIEPGFARLMYLVPNFQNPSGITLTAQRRQQVLEFAQRHDIVIVEDDPYRELRYSGEDIPALVEMEGQALGSRWNEEGRVLHLGTFSKTLAPGLRIGWVLAPTAAIHMFTLAKQGTDLHSSTMSMLITEDLIRTGTLEKNIPLLRDLYRERRDALLDSLTEFVGERAHWTQPDGGLFVWLKIPGETDTTAMLAEALKRKIAYVPGDAFFFDHSGKDTLRLNFSVTPPEKIAEGIGRLGELIVERQRTRTGV